MGTATTRRTLVPTAVMATALLAGSPPVTAQAQVWRCGKSYQEQPCDGGSPLEVDDRRSSAQAAQTREAALKDAQAADRMEKARLAQEARAPRAMVLGGGSSQSAGVDGRHEGRGKDKDGKSTAKRRGKGKGSKNDTSGKDAQALIATSPAPRGLDARTSRAAAKPKPRKSASAP